MGAKISAMMSSGKEGKVADSVVAMEAAASPAKRAGMSSTLYKQSPVMRLSEAQIDEFREAFNIFDTDGGGSIDTDELETVMRSLGQDPTPAELKKMVATADADGSGDIDFYEFVTLIAHKMAKDAESGNDPERIKNAFDVFDENGDGVIDAQEMRRIMVNLGEPMSLADVDEVLAAYFDDNGDGSIDMHEFAAALAREGTFTKA